MDRAAPLIQLGALAAPEKRGPSSDRAQLFSTVLQLFFHHQQLSHFALHHDSHRWRAKQTSATASRLK
jgi:hypothetical protein